MWCDSWINSYAPAAFTSSVEATLFVAVLSDDDAPPSCFTRESGPTFRSCIVYPREARRMCQCTVVASSVLPTHVNNSRTFRTESEGVEMSAIFYNCMNTYCEL